MKTVKIGIGSGLPEFDLSDVQEKALEWDIYAIKDWVENAIQVKVSEKADKLIIANTSKDPNKMTYAAKLLETASIDNGFTGFIVQISIGTDTIDLEAEETKLLELDDVGIKDFIENILKVKSDSCIDLIAEKETTDRIETLTEAQKLLLVTNSTVQSAYDRQAAM